MRPGNCAVWHNTYNRECRHHGLDSQRKPGRPRYRVFLKSFWSGVHGDVEGKFQSKFELQVKQLLRRGYFQGCVTCQYKIRIRNHNVLNKGVPVINRLL